MMRHFQHGLRAVLAFACLSSATAAVRSEDELQKIALDPKVGIVERTRAFADWRAVATEASVPKLIGALAEPRVSYSARSVLEVLPGPAVDQALVAALDGARDDVLRAGVIQTLGNRRAATAVRAIAMHTAAAESATASAAIDALGNIGTVEAANALLALLPPPKKLLWGDAALRCAETLLRSSRAKSLELYRAVEQNGEPAQRAAATIQLARLSKNPVRGVIAALAADAPATRAAALAAIRTDALGAPLVPELARTFPTLAPEVQVQVLYVLYDRGNRDAAPLARTAFGASDPAVQAAAAKLLSIVGGPEDVPALLSRMDGADEPAPSARLALARIPGERVTSALVGRFNAGGASRAAALEVLLNRGHRPLLDELLKPELHADETIRTAAANAVQTLATAADLERVLGLHQALPPPQRGPLETALRRIVTKDAAPERAAALVLSAMEKLPPAEAGPLTATLAALPPEPAVAALSTVLGSDSVELRTAALSALGTIRDIRAADTLLRAARAESDPALRAQAVRLAAPVFARSAQGEGGTIDQAALAPAIAGLRECWQLAERPGERNAVLGALRNLKDPAAKALAEELMKSAAAATPK